jgi:hypothetical protein
VLLVLLFLLVLLLSFDKLPLQLFKLRLEFLYMSILRLNGIKLFLLVYLDC